MASYPIYDHLDASQTENMEVESEPDDEVDQLDSESDADVSALDTSTKNGTASGGQRMPGYSLIPALRLENIIQADGKFCAISLGCCSGGFQVLPEISLCPRRACSSFQLLQ